MAALLARRDINGKAKLVLVSCPTRAYLGQVGIWGGSLGWIIGGVDNLGGQVV